MEHHSYHIKAKSAAQTAALKFSVGDKVDLVLSGDSSPEVVAIAAHTATQPES